MTCLLILINLVVFVVELRVGETFIVRWSEIPAQIVKGHHLITLVTSTFLHADWSHLLGNMLFLAAFGPAIERLMGAWRFLIFYLLGGLIANFLYILSAHTSTLPTIGASGAIAAVMGAFLVTYPRQQVKLWWLGDFWFDLELPLSVLGFSWHCS